MAIESRELLLGWKADWDSFTGEEKE